MAYETPLTIAEVMQNISANKYVLPSIQREYVWSTNQIETLFDSLMRDYPIGTFLFWEIDKEYVKKFDFYDPPHAMLIYQDLDSILDQTIP